MFRFAHQEYLYALLLIPILIVLFIIVVIMKKRAIKRFGKYEILLQLMPEVSFVRPVVKFVFVLFALIMLIFAVAQPQFGSKLEKVKRKGIEIVIALDVSNSMMATDIQPSRLENARRIVTKLIDKLENDKIGIVTFAGDAYTQVPITTDFSAAKMILSSVNTGIVSKQGTAIGTAINLAVNSFGAEEGKNRVIIIITDGENHEDDPLAAAAKAKEKGITIHTVGMGTPEGSPIPAQGGDFRKDNNGGVVVSRLDEVTLQKIAVATNGVYVRASNNSTSLNILLDEINKVQKQEIESKVYSEFDERFTYLIALALILLLIDFCILERKNRLFKNINLFKTRL